MAPARRDVVSRLSLFNSQRSGNAVVYRSIKLHKSRPKKGETQLARINYSEVQPSMQ